MNKAFYDFTVYKVPDSENFQEIISGNNERRVLVVYLDEQQEVHEVFLKKVIGAAKLDFEKDCLLLRGSHTTVLPTLSQIKSHFVFEKALIFGYKGKDLGLNIETPLYIPFQFNYCQLLFADKLSVLENSVERKKALWQGIQSLLL